MGTIFFPPIANGLLKIGSVPPHGQTQSAGFRIRGAKSGLVFFLSGQSPGSLMISRNNPGSSNSMGWYSRPPIDKSGEMVPTVWNSSNSVGPFCATLICAVSPAQGTETSHCPPNQEAETGKEFCFQAAGGLRLSLPISKPARGTPKRWAIFRGTVRRFQTWNGGKVTSTNGRSGTSGPQWFPGRASSYQWAKAGKSPPFFAVDLTGPWNFNET